MMKSFLRTLLPLAVLLLAGCEELPMSVSVKQEVKSYQAASNPAATPTFNPPSNQYNADQLVTITTTTAGATIRFTTDGSAPTAASPVYLQPVPIVAPGGVINALALKEGFKDSSVGTATYTIEYDAVATPQISPATGTYSTDQEVTITTATSGATIHYTTDGTEPTDSSAVYTGALTVEGDRTKATIKALATKAKLKNSGVASSTIRIAWPQVSTPQISPATGTYSTDQTVTITTSTSGATIHYTTDGTKPTASSAVYSAPVTIEGDGTKTTIQAIATKAKQKDSALASSTVTIEWPQVSAPQITPTTGEYSKDQSVEITTATPKATIRYTLDGSTPTTSSAVYSSALTIAGNGTVKTVNARAFKAGMVASTTTTATITIDYAKVSSVQFSPAEGTFAADQTIELSTSTSGAKIYFTLDGSKPTVASGTLYSSAIAVKGPTGSKTIKALAVKSGMADSSVSQGTFKVQWPTVATPTFSSTSGSFSSNTTFDADTTISLASTTSGATIYYTLTTGSTGADPTTSSSVYNSSFPFSLEGSQTASVVKTLKAFATKAGSVSSAIASVTVTITYPSVATPTFTPTSGSSTTDLTVNLATTTSGATLRYTTDGSTPTTSSLTYSDATPIELEGEGSYTVKVLATKSAMMNATTEKTYTIAYPRYTVTYHGNNNTAGSVPSDSTQYLEDAAFTPDTGTGLAKSSVPLGYWSTSASGSGTNYAPGVATTFPANDLDLYARYYYTSWSGVIGFSSNDTTLVDPYGIAADQAGNVYIADSGSRKIQKVSTSGSVSDVVGGGMGDGTTADDGNSLTARVSNPRAITVDGSGNLYVADASRIRKFSSVGVASTIAGMNANITGSTNGDGTAATFNNPMGIAVNAAGTLLYVADTGNDLIRKIDLSVDPVQVTTFYTVPLSESTVSSLYGLTLDSAGNVYAADFGGHVIRKITPAGVGTIFAGTWNNTGSTNATGTSAKFANPWGLSIDALDNVYVADDGNGMIRKITPAGVVTTVYGASGALNVEDTLVDLATALVPTPEAVAVDGSGRIYVTGEYLTRVYQVK